MKMHLLTHADGNILVVGKPFTPFYEMRYFFTSHSIKNKNSAAIMLGPLQHLISRNNTPNKPAVSVNIPLPGRKLRFRVRSRLPVTTAAKRLSWG